jgi:hypothetical protein
MTDSPVVSSPVLSPISRLERDDPFNLTSFFPTSRISEEEERWSWLRTEDEHEITEEPIADENSYENKTAGEVIKSEDKLGVLSLSQLFFWYDVGRSLKMLSDTLFAARGHEDLPMDDRLLSPYSDEDVVDVESLYLALHQRRRRDAQRGVADAKPAIGGLFLPADAEPVTDVNSLRSFVDGFRKFL